MVGVDENLDETLMGHLQGEVVVGGDDNSGEKLRGHY